MIIKTYISGPLDANNYLVVDEISKEAVLIDCSEFKQEILDDIKTLGAKVKYIFLTHGHFDHTIGLNQTKQAFGVKSYIGKEDKYLIEKTDLMLNMMGLEPMDKLPEIDCYIDDGQEFNIGNIKIKAYLTPGHSKGGMVYLVNNEFLFSGDTIFQGTYGRTDLWGGDIDEMISSYKNILFKFDDNIKVFSGHGSSSTIGYEKLNNDILDYLG